MSDKMSVRTDMHVGFVSRLDRVAGWRGDSRSEAIRIALERYVMSEEAKMYAWEKGLEHGSKHTKKQPQG